MEEITTEGHPDHIDPPPVAGKSTPAPPEASTTSDDIVPPDVSTMIQFLSRDYTALAQCLFIVDSPVKEGSFFSKEMSYRILVKTSLEKYEKRKFYVRRRFDDIKWLRAQLVQQFPHCIIPPLHDPKTFTQSETSDSLTRSRRRGIQRFLNRVGSHPTLSKSKVLRFFLTTEGKKFKETRHLLDEELKTQKKRIQQHKSSKFFSPPDLSSKDAATKKEMKIFKKEAESLYKTFRVLHKSSLEIVESRKSHEEAYEHFNKSLRKFCSSSPLRYPSSKADTKVLIDLLLIFHSNLEQIEQLNADHTELERDSLYEMLKDWSLYTKEIIFYAERYEEWRYIFYETKLFLESAIQKELKQHPTTPPKPTDLLDEENPDPEVVDTAPPTSPLIRETEDLLEKHRKQIEMFTDNLNTERVWFDKFRSKEIKYWTNYYATAQIAIHKKIIAKWQSYIDDFNEQIVVNNDK